MHKYCRLPKTHQKILSTKPTINFPLRPSPMYLLAIRQNKTKKMEGSAHVLKLRSNNEIPKKQRTKMANNDITILPTIPTSFVPLAPTCTTDSILLTLQPSMYKAILIGYACSKQTIAAHPNAKEFVSNVIMLTT